MFMFPSALRRFCGAALVLAFAAALTLASTGDGAARLGGGGSFGSRGTRTFSVPPSTATAPRASVIPGGGYGQGGLGQGGFGRSGGGFLSGGFGRGLLGGLVGAGLFGMLFGNGFGGGLGDGSSFIGLLLQLGLLFLLFRFAMGFFRQRQPAFGGGTGPAGFTGSQGGPSRAAPRGVPITIEAADYSRFEQRLGQAQSLYSAEDLNGLRQVATAEMVEHFGGELAGNARRGVVNRLSDVRLLQGDLAEAWREGSSEYATVAMRFSLLDVTMERAGGRVVDGNPNAPPVVTELWTFARPAGSGLDGWLLSAVQQG